MIKLCIETIDPSKLTSPLISIFNGMAALQVGELIKTRYVMHAKWLCISPERVCTSMIYMRWESHFYSNDVVGHVPLAAIAEKRKLNKMSSCLRLETPWLSLWYGSSGATGKMHQLRVTQHRSFPLFSDDVFLNGVPCVIPVCCIEERILWTERKAPRASYQLRKIAGCICAGNSGNVFTATDFNGNR